MAGKVNEHGLTEKQEAACQAYLECDGNQSEAYRRAYDAENMKPAVIWSEASILFSNPIVAKRVLILQEGHAKRHNVTIDTLTVELNEAKDLAKDTEQPSAMTGAIMGKAKIHGFITDKNQIDHTSKDGSMTPSLDMSKLSTLAIKELLAARESTSDK